MQRPIVEILVIWWRRGELRWELLPPCDREAMQVWMFNEAIEQGKRARQPLELAPVTLHRPRPPARPEQARKPLIGNWGGTKHRRGQPRAR